MSRYSWYSNLFEHKFRRYPQQPGPLPICSTMYGIFTNTCRKNHPNVAKQSLCAFCRVVVPSKPFTNTALYYKPPTRYSFISSTETYRRGWLLRLTDGRANPLMDRKVVGVVFSGVAAMVAVVNSTQLLDVAWCSAVVVVVAGVAVVVVWCSVVEP